MSQPIRMSLVAALLAVLACSSSGGGAAARCPTSQPTAGAACLLMNGTSCSYATPGGPPAGYCGGGGGAVAICQNGVWVYEATAGAGGAGVGYAACPVDVPAQGSSCTPSCGGAQQQCSYDCAHCNGSTCTATCNGSIWDVTKYTTPCSTVEAGVESGTDAEPDGGASEAGGDATSD